MPLPAQLQAQDQLCGARYFRAFKAQQNLKSFVLLWYFCGFVFKMDNLILRRTVLYYRT